MQEDATRNEAGQPDTLSLGPLPGYLGYTIRRAQVELFRDFEQRLAGLDITPGQFSLLTLVAANPGISQGALAKVHGLDKSTLSPAVDKLTQRGLVERARAPADRRFYALSLTRAGAEMLDEVRARVDGQERAMEGALAPDEVPKFLDMLRRVTSALDGSDSSGR